MTRIVAGTLGGRRLATPAGSGTRPTSDRVREALFSRTESLLGGLDGVAVLDLYAGSGALGLEALSRGAASAVLVESDRRAAAVLRSNVAALGLDATARVVADRVERLLTRSPVGAGAGPVGLVLADPPYDLPADALREVLATGAQGGWLGADALLVVERPTRSSWRFPTGVTPVGERRYGETTLWYGRAPAAPG